MNIPHILTDVISKPLMVTPDKLSVLLGILDKKSSQGINVDLSDVVGASKGTPAAAIARPVNQTNQDQIAVTSIIGSLVARNRGFSDGSGLRSYRTIQFEIQQALDAPEVGGIILDIDTYGGMVAGLDRFAQFLRNAAQEKPIYAVIDLNCYSAGYYIASACSKVILTDAVTAGVGSVGCILIHRSQSKKNKKDGIEYSTFYFGARKNDYSPHEHLTNDMRQTLQEQVDAHGMKFVSRVAENRGLSVDAVMETQAGCFYGQAAIDIGLADHIATFDEAVAMMAAEIAEKKQKTTGGSAMTTKERFEALLKNEDGSEALAELGYVNAGEAEAKAKLEGRREGVKAGLSQATEVIQVAQIGNATLEQTRAMVEAGMSATEAADAVQQANANKSTQQLVTSTTTILTDGKHPLVAACEKIAN